MNKQACCATAKNVILSRPTWRSQKATNIYKKTKCFMGLPRPYTAGARNDTQ